MFQVVSINRAKRFLQDCGYRYASESLLQSELRVLKTLKFQVTEPTPIVYIETMLEILGIVKSNFMHDFCIIYAMNQFFGLILSAP